MNGKNNTFKYLFWVMKKREMKERFQRFLVALSFATNILKIYAKNEYIGDTACLDY
jgi:hypothetical protein